MIAANPLTFPKVIGEARRIGLRKFPYNLWYRVEADESIVIGCIHAKRDTRLARERAFWRYQNAAKAVTGLTPPSDRNRGVFFGDDGLRKD